MSDVVEYLYDMLWLPFLGYQYNRYVEMYKVVRKIKLSCMIKYYNVYVMQCKVLIKWEREVDTFLKHLTTAHTQHNKSITYFTQGDYPRLHK